MVRRSIPFALSIAATLIWSIVVVAQNRVHTETIRPPSAPASPEPAAPANDTGAAAPAAHPSTALPQASASVAPTPPEIITDLARLPPRVAQMRERILEAARSGDLERVLTVMQTNEMMPVFSFGDESDPISFWKATFPESGGIEALSILEGILQTGFVHVDEKTPQEMYVWPYFARLSPTELTPSQKVELFKFTTGYDYQVMRRVGAYNFYRLGIGPDGTWHFFVAGDF